MKYKTLAFTAVVATMAVTGAFGQQTATTHKATAHQVHRGKTAEQQELDAILDELKQIRQLLADQNKYITQRTPAPVPQPAQAPAVENVSLKVEPGWEVMGRDDAPVTIVEFADFQCPFCQKFHKDSFAQLKKEFIDTGKVRFVSRDMPLDFHPFAQSAAEAARCAGEQGKFWEMRDTLISHAPDLQADKILSYASDLKLDTAAFKTCVDANKYKDVFAKDSAEAAKLGISGTPSFVIAKTTKDELHGLKVVGALPYTAFEAYINDALKPAAGTVAKAPPAKGAVAAAAGGQ